VFHTSPASLCRTNTKNPRVTRVKVPANDILEARKLRNFVNTPAECNRICAVVYAHKKLTALDLHRVASTGASAFLLELACGLNAQFDILDKRIRALNIAICTSEIFPWTIVLSHGGEWTKTQDSDNKIEWTHDLELLLHGRLLKRTYATAMPSVVPAQKRSSIVSPPIQTASGEAVFREYPWTLMKAERHW
jgi:hypothetical protein